MFVEKPCSKCKTLTNRYIPKTPAKFILCESCWPKKSVVENLYIEENLSQRDLAKKFNLPLETVRNRLKKYKINKPIKSKKISSDILEDLYLKQNLTEKQISEKFNLSLPRIAELLRKYKLTNKKSKEQKRSLVKKYDWDPTKEELENLYFVQKLRREEIAKKFNVPKNHIAKLLRKFGLTNKKKFESNRTKDCTISKKKLKDLYINQKLSQDEISKKLKVGRKIIRRWLQEVDITKSKDEWLKVRINNRFKNKGFKSVTKDELKDLYLNKNLSREQIAKKTNSSLGHIGHLLKKFKLTGIKTRSQVATSHFRDTHGCRKDVGLARSMWEANIKRLLQYLRIPYKYEPEKIQFVSKETVKLKDWRGSSVFEKGKKYNYIPDFKILTQKPFYLEVKGYLSETARFKLENAKAKYPIYVLDEEIYNKIEKEYKKKICLWETRKHSIRTHPDLFRAKQKVIDNQTFFLSEIQDFEEVNKIFNLKIGKSLKKYLPQLNGDH